jgi:hypothetical protein
MRQTGNFMAGVLPENVYRALPYSVAGKQCLAHCYNNIVNNDQTRCDPQVHVEASRIGKRNIVTMTPFDGKTD